MAFAFRTPEVEDLYRGQPLKQLRRIELWRLADAHGIKYPESATKDVMVPILQAAIDDGRIGLNGKAKPALHVPSPEQAEASVRAELESKNAFQLRAMLPAEHELRKKADAKKPDLIAAVMEAMKAA